jgi:hypothetical protein
MARSRIPPRAPARGVTPLAAAVALSAVGLGLSLWLFARDGKSESADATHESATLIHHAAQSFLAQNGEGCPTLSLLKQEHFLAAEARDDDAWGNRFRVQCSGDDVVVVSSGPDGIANTADDVRVPR